VGRSCWHNPGSDSKQLQQKNNSALFIKKFLSLGHQRATTKNRKKKYQGIMKSFQQMKKMVY